MQAIIRSFVLLLCVTFARGKDCTREDFLTGDLFDANFDTSGLADSYASGKQVRVGCNIGYSGFFKLICQDDGTWDSRGTVCEPRSCGHPGDAAFADFQLETGEDFVFGSKVIYICHKGYQMVSRRNYRRCMAEGWDGHVPVCEAQQCPVIHVKNNVKVTGDPEEAAFGNVVRFSCKSNTEVLNGPAEVYCDETGEWSGADWKGVPPKCEEIICRVPDIANGHVPGPVREYRENELLNFACNAGFTPGSGVASKCNKVGQIADWSPTPACEQIRCKLELPALWGTTYDPASKSLFLPGDVVTVTCGESYWIQNTQTTSAETTCQPDGQWTLRPVCEEVICSNVREAGVSYWNIRYWEQKKLGSKVSFTCRSDHTPTDGAREATCTRDGWTPSPLCREITCRRRDFEFATIRPTSVYKDVYRSRERVDYVCRNYYQETFSLYCGADGWIGEPRCPSSYCHHRVIENAQISQNRKATYWHGEKVQYTCSNNAAQRFTITCNYGVWKGIKSCTEERPCPRAEVPNGFVAGPFGDTVYYTCDEGYKLSTAGWWGVAKCEAGVWSGLHRQRCIEETRCQEPPPVANGRATPQQSYGAQTLQITCRKGYEAAAEQLTCRDGQWLPDGESFKNLCLPVAAHCGPPPRVENAVVLTPYRKEFLSDSTVTYGCRENFSMEGADTITCTAGTWEEGNTTCTRKPCPLPEDTPHASYDIISGSELVSGATVRYSCDDGYRLVGQNDTMTCLFGAWSNGAPTCERVTCKADATNSSLVVTGLPAAGEAMEPGHTLQFECDDDLGLDGAPRIQCLPSGEWSAPFPSCSERCEITGVPTNVRLNRLLGEKLSKGQTVTFSCYLRTHFLQSKATVECLANGQWSHQFPSCGPAPMTCGNPPPLADGDTKESPKYIYQHNEQVEYVCQNVYTMKGGPHKTCINGEWTGEVTCLKACTVDREAMNRNNIRFRYTRYDKIYSPHEDEIEFACKSGRPAGDVAMRQTCINGEMTLPSCA